MTTITVDTTFAVAAGQTLNFANEPGFLLSPSASGPADILTIAGEVDISLSPGTSVNGIGVDFFSQPPANAALTIASTGVLRVISTLAPHTSGQSIGFDTSNDIDFINHGTVQVESNDVATGAFSFAPDGWQFVNTGNFAVISHGGQAEGVVTTTSFENSGTFSVSGVTQVVGVNVTFPTGLIHNSGTILATDSDLASDSVGVLLRPLTETTPFINDGRIEADVALEVFSDATVPPETYINNGVLVGRVHMGQAQAQLINSGLIQGRVDFGDGNDLYDGHLGTVTGVVSAGAGADTMLGGAAGDTLQGADGDDSLSGGGGDDTLVGGAGHDQLTGGIGANHFIVGHGDSGVTLGTLDEIADWTSTDILNLGNLAGTGGNYVETTAPTFSAALAAANSQISSGAADIVAVAVGSDVVVFGDTGGNNGTAEDAILLSGRTLADITFINFTGPAGSSPPVSPPPLPVSPPVSPPAGSSLPPPVGGVQNGTGADDAITATQVVGEIHASSGNDTVFGGATQDYLRGDDGDDSLVGGVGFDDINGNKGDDTIDGGAGLGNDWLVGGQSNDSITAHSGQNLLYGNLGNDTLHGGSGGDVLRGGQGDDVVVGGSGNDFVSGDRGSDTVSGGAGADNFHSSQDAGVDRVLDFHATEGDRVQLDPGTTYTLSQVGADTVIDMGSGNQMILVGVQLSSLSRDWIFEA